jgi:hypothetical protein
MSGIYITKPEINIREKIAELDYGRVPYEKMPAGSVIQVANATGDNGIISTTTGQYINTPYSVSISPKFSSSKIFILLNFSVLLRCGSGAYDSAALGFSLLRGSTRITNSPNNPHTLFITGPNTLMGNTQSLSYLDSPNTTSAITYLLQAWPRYANQTTEFDSRDSTWTFTLMEIKQ